MTFSNRLSGILILYVIGAISLLIASGFHSYKLLTEKNQEHKISQVIKLIDYQLLDQSRSEYMAFWIPHWLKANEVLRLELHSPDATLFTYRDQEQRPHKRALIRYDFNLQRHSDLRLSIWMLRPLQTLYYSKQTLFSLSITLLIVILGLWVTIRWIKRNFKGAEQLEIRGQKILSGDHLYAQPNTTLEWPKSATLAIDKLQQKLKDAEQDRSRFDTFIRQNAFIDPLTGLGNKTQLRNQLNAELGATSSNTGVILLIDLPQLSAINHEFSEQEGDELLKQTSHILINSKKRYANALLTRYSGGSFALLLPLVTNKEGETAATSVMKQLYRMPLPEGYFSDQFFYIGVTGYHHSDSTYQIMEDLEMALRIASLQGASSWHMHDKEVSSPATVTGSVRWRTLLQKVIDQNQIQLHLQPILDRKNRVKLHELMGFIHDEYNNKLSPAILLPMADKSGMRLAFEEAFWQQALSLIKTSKISKYPISIALTSATLLNHKFHHNLLVQLLEFPVSVRKKIIIQLTENQLEIEQEQQWENIHQLKQLGCKLLIAGAGQSVVSTHYIRELKVDYLKIHPGLIRRIDRNPMNQIAIRSLLGSCADKPISVIANGINNSSEWNTLKQLGIDAGQGNYLGVEQAVSG